MGVDSPWTVLNPLAIGLSLTPRAALPLPRHPFARNHQVAAEPRNDTARDVDSEILKVKASGGGVTGVQQAAFAETVTVDVNIV